MTDEFIDILSDNLKVIKVCLKSDAHKNGWFHASVHIWFYTNDGKLLFQKRSKNKIAFPDLWDISVAGHISSGENPINSALREIEEEIGLAISENNLLKIGEFKELHQHTDDFIDNEIHHIYISELTIGIDTLKIQKEELSALKLVTISKFKAARTKPDFDKQYVPHFPEYYNFVLVQIEKQLNQHS